MKIFLTIVVIVIKWPKNKRKMLKMLALTLCDIIYSLATTHKGLFNPLVLHRSLAHPVRSLGKTQATYVLYFMYMVNRKNQ